MQVPQEDSLASTDTEAAKVAASAMARSRRKGREVSFSSTDPNPNASIPMPIHEALLWRLWRLERRALTSTHNHHALRLASDVLARYTRDQAAHG